MKGLVEHRERMDHELVLATIEFQKKFKMFFAGLIFAVLSFASSHTASNLSTSLKIIEIIALAFMLLSGLLLLLNLSGVRVRDSFQKLKSQQASLKKYYYLILYFIFNLNIHYWFCFIVGLTLLLVRRSIGMFS